MGRGGSLLINAESSHATFSLQVSEHNVKFATHPRSFAGVHLGARMIACLMCAFTDTFHTHLRY